MTKVTAAYAIWRTTQKVAYFGIREDKNIFFFFSDKFSFKLTTYRYTCIACPDVYMYSRDSKRTQYVIHIHTNIITTKTKLLQFRLYCHTYVYIFGVRNWLPTRIFRCLIRKKQEKFLCRKMFRPYLQPTQTRISFVWGIFLRLYRDRYMRITTHCIVVQRSRITGTVPPLPQYVFTACKETN